MTITDISTHSPRVGRTIESRDGYITIHDFNSLAPCGANLQQRNVVYADVGFQLTRPMRDEPICSERVLRNIKISTHSPHAGRTRGLQILRRREIHFNSLAPRGANLANIEVTYSTTRISTHSPRAGRTTARSYRYQRDQYFNSLAPCGANRSTPTAKRAASTFQLTRPVRGEPIDLRAWDKAAEISTHSPHAGEPSCFHVRQ